MSLETKNNLDDTTVEGLQKLIRYNIDACKGFRESAETVKDAGAKTLFQNIADQRSDFAESLQQYVTISGEEAVEEGSAMAAVHRVWLDVRSAINGGDIYPVLCEAERGEDQIKSAYETVLKDTAGSPINDVLTKQYAQIKLGHDGIRDLRDSVKAKR